ncbi:MAG TPA: cytochrome P450 [Ohtaekwangia sp.]|nr:cytochrome P450 [Ohtaekwangia sp.]
MKKYNFPAGYSFFASIDRMFKQVKDPIGSMEESLEHFGGTYSVYLGLTRMIVTQDPDFTTHVLKTNHRNYHKSAIQTKQLGRFLGKGLLTSNGDYWLKQRRLIQPGFHADKIQALYGIIKKTIDEFLVDFPVGKEIDVFPLMNKLAFQLVINTLFDVEVAEEKRNELSRFINEAQAFVVKDVRQPYKRWWFRLSGEMKKNLDQASRARNIIREIIRERQRHQEKFNDLLDMLLDARYEDTGTPMEEEQIIDEIMVLTIAGHDTTANALAWALFLLAKHPNQLEKLKEATIDIDLQQTVSSDPLNCVIQETMRLYPPAWIVDRVSLAADRFSGFSFPANTIVILFYYGMHRDKKYWEDPDSFLPERFSKSDASKGRHKAYYPFGAGPRLCIGNNFAMAEMTIFLQTFIHQFRIITNAQTPVINPLITLKPDRVMLSISRLRNMPSG